MPKKAQKKASAAQKAADRAREAQQRRAAEDERAREEEERRSDEESDGAARESDHEEGATGGSERGSHEEGGVTKEKANCSFSTKKEERLVEFFSVNPTFYDKSHPKYQDQQQKDKLLDQLAKELHTTSKYPHFPWALGDSRGHSEQELGEELGVHSDVSDKVPPRFTL